MLNNRTIAQRGGHTADLETSSEAMPPFRQIHWHRISARFQTTWLAAYSLRPAGSDGVGPRALGFHQFDHGAFLYG